MKRSEQRTAMSEGPRRAGPVSQLRHAGLCLAAGLGFAASVPAQNDIGTVLSPPVLDGTNVIINWNSGGALQTAPTVSGPWATATGGLNVNSSLLAPIAGGARFFRVVENGVPGSPIPLFPTAPDDPLSVQQATIRRLPQPTAEGDAVLEIRFENSAAGNQKKFPLLLDDRLITVRDDGVFPDRREGDGLYGTIIPVDMAELQEMNARIAELKPEERVQPRFEGRQIVGTNQINFFNLTDYNAGQAVQVFPFPFGVAGETFDFPNAFLPAGFAPAALPPAIPHKSLMITDLSVVEDPLRTWDPCNPAGGTPMGAWTFGRLMTDMANTPVTGITPSDFVRRWLRHWQVNQTINFDGIPNRDAALRAQMLDDWQTASGGPGAPLNLAIAPFRLLAIVNRVDLRANTTYGGGTGDPCNPPCLGGEARFVFCMTSPGCGPLLSLVILEYCVPKSGCKQLKSWAKQWKALEPIPFGPIYNARLQAITDQFAKANADPSRLPNKSAINQIRSNEILDFPWDMREWRIFPNDSDAGHLREVTVKQTPDFDLNNLPILAAYVNAPANIPLILAEKHTVPLTFLGTPFLGGSAPMPTPAFFWDGPGAPGSSILTPNLRHKFSLNTCNGCHAGETSTFFTHVSQRPFGFPATLSGFLTGILAPDPAGVEPPKAFNDLARRAIDLDTLANTPCFFHIFHRPTLKTH